MNPTRSHLPRDYFHQLAKYERIIKSDVTSDFRNNNLTNEYLKMAIKQIKGDQMNGKIRAEIPLDVKE